MSNPNQANSSRQRRILQAAARVLRQKGRAATVEDIAREADYSAAALYRHFSGKEQIFSSLALEIASNLRDLFTEAPPLELPFEANLKWVLYRLAEFAEQERDMFIATMMWLPTLSPDELPLDKFTAFDEGFTRIMQQGIDEGVLRADGNPQLYAMALGGMLSAINHRWCLQGPFEMKPKIDAMYDIFLRGAGAD